MDGWTPYWTVSLMTDRTLDAILILGSEESLCHLSETEGYSDIAALYLLDLTYWT